MDNSTEKLLNYAIQNGIINLDDVRDVMREQERQRLLSQHKYKIFQANDGRWKTTLPAINGEKRKLIAKTSRQDLEDLVIDFYSQLETNSYALASDITLEELYPIWFESRLLEVKSIGTAKKNEQDWNRYYAGTEIVRIPMKNLTVNRLKDWAHSIIDKHNLSKKSYYNMTIIMKKCFEFVESEGVCKNTWKDVKINTSKLRKPQKKENSTQIYFNDEKSKLVCYSLQMFMNNPRNISALAIPLLFITGMRIGELVALKYEDLTDYEITINRSEVNAFEYDKKKQKMVYKGKEIADHAKTDAGIRAIPYTKGAKRIIELIRESSEKYGFYDDDFIFCPKSKRIESNSIDTKLYRYCDNLGIPKKSAHKIRKTYISQIIKDGVDLDTVCRISGHVDLKTTFESYLFCLDRKEEVYDKFEEILSLPYLNL